jgi:hypothetical protein
MRDQLHAPGKGGRNELRLENAWKGGLEIMDSGDQRNKNKTRKSQGQKTSVNRRASRDSNNRHNTSLLFFGSFNDAVGGQALQGQAVER